MISKIDAYKFMGVIYPDRRELLRGVQAHIWRLLAKTYVYNFEYDDFEILEQFVELAKEER